MSLEADIRSLASPDKDVQATARRTLIASGAAAVPPLMAHLRDEDSPIAWSATAWVLRQIGEPAAQPLIDVIASDASEEVRRRARWAFNGLKVAEPAGLAPAFTHADPRVRAAAARLVQNRDADGTASVFTGLLLDLLGDQDDDVRHSAVSALAAIGEPVADVLRGIRRAPSTGRRRRATALAALAEIGGRDALDAHDRALVSRLIAIKQLDERPEPMHLCGSWYALPSCDETEVFAAFDLSDPVPATMRMGADAWNRDHHSLT
ncbi:MAG: hypothetical protein HOW97_21005, partial [Catenulispora sp.]|nr:hypothetical protein [Catenulispora sp.]